MSGSQYVPSRRPPSRLPSSRLSGRFTGRPAAFGASLRPRADNVEIHAPSGLELVIDYAVPGCVIAHMGNITFSAWNTVPAVEHVEAFMALAKDLCATYPLNSNVSLVMRNTELPGAAARAALEELTAQYASKIHSVALVIGGQGFWASMIRSFLTGLHSLRGNGYRCKAFANASEAAPWLLPAHNAETGVSLSTRELEAACDAVYARMQSAGTPAMTG